MSIVKEVQKLEHQKSKCSSSSKNACFAYGDGGMGVLGFVCLENVLKIIISNTHLQMMIAQ